jgi:hypothetical protein
VQHVASMRQATQAVTNQVTSIRQSLTTLSRMNPQAAKQLTQAFQPAFDRALQLTELASESEDIITKISESDPLTPIEQTMSTRLAGGAPLATGVRDAATLVSSQLAQRGQTLLPLEIAEAGSIRSTMDRIRQSPVTLDELRDRAKQVGTAVSGGIAHFDSARCLGEGEGCHGRESGWIGGAALLRRCCGGSWEIGSSLVTPLIIVMPPPGIRRQPDVA